MSRKKVGLLGQEQDGRKIGQDFGETMACRGQRWASPNVKTNWSCVSYQNSISNNFGIFVPILFYSIYRYFGFLSTNMKAHSMEPKINYQNLKIIENKNKDFREELQLLLKVESHLKRLWDEEKLGSYYKIRIYFIKEHFQNRDASITQRDRTLQRWNYRPRKILWSRTFQRQKMS